MTDGSAQLGRIRQMAMKTNHALRSSAPGRWLAGVSRTLRSHAQLAASGLFDVAHYLGQLAPDDVPEDPLQHYLTVGAGRGLSPHPLFDRAYYVEKSERARASSADPFVEFVSRGCQRGDDPHPLFDTGSYLDRAPEAASHRYGAFGHFMSTLEAPWPMPRSLWSALPTGTGPISYVDLVARAVAAHDAEPDYSRFPVAFDRFDHESADAFVAAMRQATSVLDEPPLVAVIIPTKDRLTTVLSAIASVQAQSYAHWELFVVDDGGTDGTGEAVTALAQDDSRIHYVWQQNTGVSGARNHGISLSSGQYVAYLDSDNTWVPEYLEVMVGVLRRSGARGAYAASELRRRDRVQYRGQPLNGGALLVQNYIDCITIVHERSLLDEVGPFDERLKRFVDWDLLIRLSAATELRYAPFIGTSYDVWDATRERITHHESGGYRQVVRDKYLTNWQGTATSVNGRSSIIVVSSPDSGPLVLDTLLELARGLSGRSGFDHEFVVVDNGLDRRTSLLLRVAGELVAHVRILRLAPAATTPVARNWAGSVATGDVLVMVDGGVRVSANGIAVLADSVRRRRSALVQPLVVGNDGTVCSAGQFLGPHGSAITWGSGLAADEPMLAGTRLCDGVEGSAFAVDASTYRELHGLDPLFTHGGSDLDLGLRAASLGVDVILEPTVIARLVSEPSEVMWFPTAEDRREFTRRWSDVGVGRAMRQLRADIPVTRLDALAAEDDRAPKRWAALPGRKRGGRRRWAIKTSVPNAEAAETWGDWHFARALRDALRELGDEAVIDTWQAWRRRSTYLDDINLVLRGTARFEPNPSQINILWVISHPDLITREEVGQFDRVFVASHSFPGELRKRWGGIDVRPLLQCTDPNRFRPDPDPSFAEDLLFVGNSRSVLRPIVKDAIAAGLRPAIFGTGWDGRVPDEFIRGGYLPNELLNKYYSSAGVVLNDHWDDMRRHGFVSNRLFDAVASGAVVVSDDVDGIDGLFGDRIVAYSSPDNLAAAVERARTLNRDEHPTVADVHARHSFRARAEELVRTADELADQLAERRIEPI